jgi:hypothetical protein
MELPAFVALEVSSTMPVSPTAHGIPTPSQDGMPCIISAVIDERATGPPAWVAGRALRERGRGILAGTANGNTRLTPKQLEEVFRLIGGADSVEIKLVVPMEAHRAAFKSLELDPIEAELRQVFFFDTPDLRLNRAGVVVRARRTQGGGGDTVIKLRPVDPSMIDQELRRSESFKVEVDVLPGGFVCSASSKGRCTASEVLDVASADAPARSLFSAEQRAFYMRHAPAGTKLDALVPFGPTFVLKTRVRPRSFDRRLTVEMWLFPDGSRSVEVSTKSEPGEAFEVAAALRNYLGKAGIPIIGDQQTKTRSAIEFFRAEMKPRPAAPRRRAKPKR